MVTRNMWLDVKETSRTYVYPEGRFCVEKVSKLRVSSGGSHYLETLSGQKVIARCGWMVILIDAEEWSIY